MARRDDVAVEAARRLCAREMASQVELLCATVEGALSVAEGTLAAADHLVGALEQVRGDAAAPQLAESARIELAQAADWRAALATLRASLDGLRSGFTTYRVSVRELAQKG